MTSITFLVFVLFVDGLVSRTVLFLWLGWGSSYVKRHRERREISTFADVDSTVNYFLSCHGALR